MPAPVARATLDELTRSASLDFDAAEAAAAAAHVALRTSSARRMAFDRAKIEMPDDVSGPIEASIFSLNTAFFTPAEARRFLEAVHTASPDRRLIVLGDAAMRDALSHAAVLDVHSRPFTPWPRDPFVVGRSPSGGVVFINRPNAQPTREEDQNMVRAIVQQLPAAIDTAWKHPRWTVAPTAFHNGQILLTPANVWISMHSVEARALALLGLDRVPADTFQHSAAIEQYFDAIRRAARELETFYGKPVRFVHPLSPALVDALAGGAGVDLDSIVTFLPRADGKTDALVGDINLGVVAGRRAPAGEWTAAREQYRFRDDPEVVRNSVIEAQQAEKTIALQRFLDLIASQLQREGMTVRRLPLLRVPASLVSENLPDAEFLMTWNNVVLEKRGQFRRAEGFGSLLSSFDAMARQAFAASGYRLDLFPPLVHSILLGGGYRCASNHVRPAGGRPPRKGTGRDRNPNENF